MFYGIIWIYAPLKRAVFSNGAMEYAILLYPKYLSWVNTCQISGSNPGPLDFQSNALLTALFGLRELDTNSLSYLRSYISLDLHSSPSLGLSKFVS